MKETYTQKEFDDEWRKGYDIGFKAAMREHDEAVKIGNAVLDVLDNRYQFKKEDY